MQTDMIYKSTTFLLVWFVLIVGIRISQHDVLAGFLLLGSFLSCGATSFDNSSFDGLVWIVEYLPRRVWKIQSIFLFYLAEHCMNPQKSLFLANYQRNFFVWWISGCSLSMRSDLFCTRRQGINASDPISTFSWISFFHLIVSYTVDLSVAEHTTMHPCLEKVYRVHPGGTFLILR